MSNTSPRKSNWKSRSKWIGGGLSVMAVCVGIKYVVGSESASAQAPGRARAQQTSARSATAAPVAAQAQPTNTPPRLATLATVNGEEIQRQELGQECLDLYGEEILEGLVNKQLIALYCKKKNIVITRSDVDQEIENVASKFKLPKDEWLKMLSQERGISVEQYSEDIIWPTLAMRRLSEGRIEVTEEEIQKAFESQFGESVRVRMIVLDSDRAASNVHAQAVANPDNFGRLAHEHSVDVNSASAAGLIQPIRRHVGDPTIEKVAFELNVGQISPAIPVGNQFVIIKCEGRLPAQRNIAQESVRGALVDAIKERKVRGVASDVFEVMQKETDVQIIFGDEAKSAEHAGIAAILNGQKLTIQELADQCIQRHGEKILDGIIHRRLLEQELRRRKLVIQQSDINAEVARAAIQMGKITPSGEADIDAWLKMATDDQGLTLEQYVRDAVWPTVALKKIVGSSVTISPDDIQKGFEANYGPRVRCRAIVLANQRKAQEVWELARTAISTQTYDEAVSQFGKLAREYSIEASSRDLGGQVPPIQKHGGQPLVEQEAFKLKRGELSSIIQVADKYIVLLSEGFTEPTKVTLEDVESIIRDDIQEKKLRIAMAAEFARLKDTATIDNFLAGTSQSPKRNVPANTARSSSVRTVEPAGYTEPVKR